MSFLKKSKKGKGEDVRKSSLSEDSELTEVSVNSGARKETANEVTRKTSGAEVEKKLGFFDKRFNRGSKVTPTLDSSKGSQDGQQPSESDPHHDGPTTETESHQEAKVSEQLDAVCVVELDQEPKSKPSTSAAASSQQASTLQDDILKVEQEKAAMAQKIVELKKHVALLEDRLNENQKQLHEKVDWYSNQLMKCDKQREALEGEVSVLKSEKEALKNDAIKQDKELSTAVAALKLRDEQYVAVDQVLVGLKDKLNQLHTTISALKADLIARLDECEVLKKQIAVKLEEYSHHISDLSTTLSKEKEEKALVDTELKKAEASIVTLHIELERCRSEKTILEQDCIQEAQSTLNAEVVKWQNQLVMMEERLNNEIANKSEEKAVLETNLKHLEVQANELEKENAAKEAEIKKKEEENAELKHKVEELLKDKVLANEKQVNEVMALQQQLEQIRTEKDHLMARVEGNLQQMTNDKNELEAEAIQVKEKHQALVILNKTQENHLRQTEAALEVAVMKIAEEAKERLREKEIWEVKMKEKVSEQYDQLKHEMSMQEQQHRAELLKEKEDNEVKQQQEMAQLRGEFETLNRRSEELQKDFEMKLIKLEGEKVLNLEKILQLEKELQAANATIEKIEYDKNQEIARLKEQIHVHESKVEERDKTIEELRRTFKSESKYFKSDKEDEELFNNVSQLVEFCTRHIGVNMQSEYLDTKIKQLELKVEQLTDENKELHITLGTHQSPTASLMPSSIIVLREALQLNEAESNGLKEEIAVLKVELETYEVHCKRQSEAIVKLKEELDSVKGQLAELQRYKCNAEDELRSLRARSAAHDSLRNHVLTASEDMCVQIETLKNEKESLQKELQMEWTKSGGLTKELSAIKMNCEAVQVALQEADRKLASEVNKLKQQISRLESEKEKLSKSHKSLCMELNAITEKNKSLEEKTELLQAQADMYKKDFESERDDRTRLAGQIAQAKFSQTFKQEQRHFGEEEHLKKTKLESVQEAYTKAVKKVSDCDKEISDLRQTLQTKEETWKRSLEEARVSSSKLDDEVKLLTQQVKQYKKQADNLRSQLEKYEQMNKSQVQQTIDSEVNSQQVKRIAHQPDPMLLVRQLQQHEEAHAHHLKEQPPSPFPLMANPPNNVYSQGYGYQPSLVYASSRGPAGMAPSRSPPPKHNPRQEVPEDDDNLPPPIMLPNQLPTQSRSPVKVRAASSQPYNTPYQQPYQSQPQQPTRYAQVDVGVAHSGPTNNDHSHVQSEWRQPSDMQVYVNPQPYLGMSAPQPRQPAQNSPHVMPSVPSASKGSNPDQGIDIAKGIDDDISEVMDKLQSDGRASNSSVDAPFDPNLKCPVCQTLFRKGEIQAFSRHVKWCGK